MIDLDGDTNTYPIIWSKFGTYEYFAFIHFVLLGVIHSHNQLGFLLPA